MEAVSGGWHSAHGVRGGHGVDVPGWALERLHGYARFCQTHQSSAKGLDSSMVAPFSPASLATCNRAVLSAQDQSAVGAAHPSHSSSIHTHLTECCRPAPSIILSGNTQGQHFCGGLDLGSPPRGALTRFPGCLCKHTHAGIYYDFRV